MASKKIKPPKGTRDLYPEDLLRQRYITNAWRDASIRCGFDEIAGPTFESTDLYAVKSGDGILGELFQAFSGKGGTETLNKLVEKGKADFALRPEFTPTLARMYAAKSKELPKPCKWFTAGPYFRAERPQRGRLREFLQWNCDIIGLPGEESEAIAQTNFETWEVITTLITDLGLVDTCTLKFNDREAIVEALRMIIYRQSGPHAELSEERVIKILSILDQRAKLPHSEIETRLSKVGISLDAFDAETKLLANKFKDLGDSKIVRDGAGLVVMKGTNVVREDGPLLQTLRQSQVTGLANHHTLEFDPTIVRGLAYYTGMVFELITDGERAVAGGGRYDNLIELFGGPPTPACGFGMGDVVLGNLLDDKELMPTGTELMEAVARPQASIRPEAFVVPNGDEENEALVHTLTANLRRGIETEKRRKPWKVSRYTVAPMHARISYKSTRKINKLKADASNQHAKFFVEIHADNKVELTNMDTGEAIASPAGSWHVDPASDHYIGAAIADQL